MLSENQYKLLKCALLHNDSLILCADDFIKPVWISSKPITICFRKSRQYRAEVDHNDDIGQVNLGDIVSQAVGLDDPLLQSSILQSNPPHPTLQTGTNYPYLPGYFCFFEGLTNIILGQQVSLPLAKKMRATFLKTFGTYRKKDVIWPPTPKDVLAQIQKIDISKLGISKMKLNAIFSAAELFTELNYQGVGSFKCANFRNIRPKLIEIKGIGEWTCDWFDLKALRKFNTLPIRDLMVRKAWSWWLKSEALLNEKEAQKLITKQYPKDLLGPISYRIAQLYMDHLATLKASKQY